MNKKIVITGGNGRFAKVLKHNNRKLDIFYPDKKKRNFKINKILW